MAGSAYPALNRTGGKNYDCVAGACSAPFEVVAMRAVRSQSSRSASVSFLHSVGAMLLGLFGCDPGKRRAARGNTPFPLLAPRTRREFAGVPYIYRQRATHEPGDLHQPRFRPALQGRVKIVWTDTLVGRLLGPPAACEGAQASWVGTACARLDVSAPKLVRSGAFHSATIHTIALLVCVRRFRRVGRDGEIEQSACNPYIRPAPAGCHQ